MHILSILAIIVFGLSTMRNYNSASDLKKGPFKTSMMLIGIAISWWAFTSSQFYIADCEEGAWVWHRLSSLAWLTIIPGTSMYMIYMAGRGDLFAKFRNRMLFYFLPSVLIFYSLFGSGTPVATKMVQSRIGLGWTYTNSITSIWLWLYVFTLIGYMAFAIHLLNKNTVVSEMNHKAKLAKFFSIFDTCMITAGLITDVIMPLFTDYFVPIASILNVAPVIIYAYMSKMYDTVHVERYISSEVIFKTSTAAFLVIDEKGIIFFNNDKAVEIFAKNNDELKNLNFSSLVIHDENFNEIMEELRSNRCFYNKIIHVQSDDVKRSLMISAAQAHDKHNDLLGYVISCQDVTKIISVTELLEKQNNTDELTKLLNRRCFFEKSKQYIKNYEEKDLNFAAIYIDIDNFKMMNDTYGHSFGDLVLIEISKVLKSILKDGETLFRIGGDEFVILIKDEVNLIERTNELENVLDSLLDTPLKVQDKICDINLSYGSNLYSEARSLEELMKNTDSSMYKHKKSKVNQQ